MAENTESQATETVSTMATLNGQSFDWRTITPAQLETAFNSLPEYQRAQAAGYASLAMHYETLHSLKLPSGMSLQNAIQNTRNAMSAHGGTLPDNADQYMKDIVALKDTIPGVTLVEGAADFTTGTAKAAAVGIDILGVPGRVLDALGATASELSGAVGGGMSKENAERFAKAVVVATVAQGEARRAMPMVDSPFNDQPSQLGSNFGAYVGAAWDYVGVNVPVIGGMVPFLESVIAYGKQLFSDAPARSFSEIYAESRQRFDDLRSSGQNTFAALADARSRENDRAAGVEQLRTAEVVAGVPMGQELTSLADKGGVYTGQDGKTHQFNAGAPLPEDQVALENGQAQGRMDRMGNAWAKVPGKAAEMFQTDPVATTIGATGGSYVLYRGLKAGGKLTWRAGKGLSAEALQNVGDWINTPEGATLRQTQQRVDELTARQTQLGEQLEAAKARQAGATGTIERLRANRAVSGLEADIKEVETDLKGGKSGWFGKEKPGALAELETAKDAVNTRAAAPGKHDVARARHAERFQQASDRVAGRESSATAKTAAVQADDVAQQISREARVAPAAKVAGAVVEVAEEAPKTGVAGMLARLGTRLEAASGGRFGLAAKVAGAGLLATAGGIAMFGSSPASAQTPQADAPAAAPAKSDFEGWERMAATSAGATAAFGYAHSNKLAQQGGARAGAAAATFEEVMQTKPSIWGRLVGASSKMFALFQPTQSAVQTVRATAAGHGEEAAVRGTETAAYAGVAYAAGRAAPTLFQGLKLGLTRAAPAAAPIAAGADLTMGVVTGDERQQRRGGVALATIGGCAATGAALGCFGGPFAPLTVPAGALIGTTVGGIASIFTGMWAESTYAKNHPKPQTAAAAAPVAPQGSGALGAPDKGIQVALTDQQKQAARMAFANVKDVHSGTPVPQGSVTPTRTIGGVDIDHLRIG